MQKQEGLVHLDQAGLLLALQEATLLVHQDHHPQQVDHTPLVDQVCLVLLVVLLVVQQQTEVTQLLVSQLEQLDRLYFLTDDGVILCITPTVMEVSLIDTLWGQCFAQLTMVVDIMDILHTEECHLMVCLYDMLHLYEVSLEDYYFSLYGC